MENQYLKFYGDHIFGLTILLLLILSGLSQLIFKMWNRFIRSRNIKNSGWPPRHLDADGDFKPEPKKE